MIQGQTVILQQRIKTGVDGFGKSTYRTETATIDGVLIAPTSTDDVLNIQNLEGKKAVYTLAIPKGDIHTWENNIVEFYGKKWKTIGIPLQGIEENIPLRWNKKVLVERYE